MFVNPDQRRSISRLENEIFSDLESLCALPGFIHALAFFSFRDNFTFYTGQEVVAKDLTHRNPYERIIPIEIATLIGLMAKQPIDLVLPMQKNLQTLVDRAEALLQELHFAIAKPLFQGLNFEDDNILGDDPLTTGLGMREPIFYSGVSAYNFQYQDLARLKYKNDNDWLEENMGFRIEEACQVATGLLELLMDRLQNPDGFHSDQVSNQATLLQFFTFTIPDAAKVSGIAFDRVENFLNAFSFDENERNDEFSTVSDFNVINALPIYKVVDGSYILLQPHSLLEAIYESPFFWMSADKTYLENANINRGKFTENFSAARLETVFGESRVWRSVNIYKGKNRVGEIDALVLFGDRAIVVQAKAKRLTIESRKGNDQQLQKDFQLAIQESYDQAFLCAEALIQDGFEFEAASGAIISIRDKPRVIFPICVVADHYPALASQARQFLQSTATKTIHHPLVTDVFVFDTIAEMLSTPLHFLNYLTLRARYDGNLGRKPINVPRGIPKIGWS